MKNESDGESQSGRKDTVHSSGQGGAFRPAPHPLLQNPDWYPVFEEHSGMQPSEFALKYGGKSDLPVREIAEQLHCYPRAKSKLGDLHRPGMVYTRESLEQSSGYAAARFRAAEWMPDIEIGTQRASEKPLILDPAGGIGIDAAAWAMAGANVCYCEKNGTLAAIARHNHQILGVSDRITYHIGDGMRWLAQRRESGEPPADLLYIDPSRRTAGRRVASLEESEPKIREHISLIRESARSCLLKLSPMLDVSLLQRSLSGWHKMAAVSVSGEVKELIAWNNEMQNGESPEFRNADADEYLMEKEAVLLRKDGSVAYRTGMVKALIRNSGAEPSNHSESVSVTPPKKYLFESDPAIFKMDLTGHIAARFRLTRINHITGFLTGDHPIPEFPGTCYRIRESHPYKPAILRRYLAEKNLRRVHIHQRGFPDSVDTLYKKLGCVMGDEAHFVATTDHKGNFVIFVTEYT